MNGMLSGVIPTGAVFQAEGGISRHSLCKEILHSA